MMGLPMGRLITFWWWSRPEYRFRITFPLSLPLQSGAL